MADNVLAAPQSTLAIQKPQPIQVRAPLANQVAQAGLKPMQITSQMPSGYDRQRQNQLLADADQSNLKALSAFSGLVADKLKAACGGR